MTASASSLTVAPTQPLAASAAGAAGDGKLTIVYDPATGNLSVETDGRSYNGLYVISRAGRFTGQPVVFPENSDPGTRVDDDDEIYFDNTGTTVNFGDRSLGDVAQTMLDLATLQGDLDVIYSNAQGGGVGDVRVVPEPGALSLLGLAGLAGLRRRRRTSGTQV